MSGASEHLETMEQSEVDGESLRQALLRLTHPHYAELKSELEQLQDRLAELIAAQETLVSTGGRQDGEISGLNIQTRAFVEQISDLQAGVQELAGKLENIQTHLEAQTDPELQQTAASLSEIRSDLDSADAMSKRLLPVLVPAIHNRAREDSNPFATAISPVIGPAIRQQIRSARQDIIDALYPVIGNIISKALSEELRTLSRKIDAQLRRQLNLQKRLSNQFARLRGISEGELLLRDALPYAFEHAFLVHQRTGLLLAYQHAAGEETVDPDLIGGMMTAIGDFVKDSFGRGEGALEEIAYGEKRILIEGAQYAILAVVLEGVEPPGYNHLLRSMVNQINLKAEKELRDFDGVMQNLPDFQNDLQSLVEPDPETLAAFDSPETLARGQRLFMVGAVLSLVFLLALVAFACLYAVRLWPLVFP